MNLAPLRSNTLPLAAALMMTANLAADCGPFFAAPRQALTIPRVFPGDLDAADLNADGRTDLVYASRANNATGVTILLDNGAGTYTQSQFIPMPTSPEYLRTLLADLDGDGILDLLATEYVAGSVNVHRGNGDGTFAVTPASFACGAQPSAIDLADLNNDGRHDLAVTNKTPGTLSVLMGNGDGTFQNPVAYSTAVVNPNGLRLADLNADGRLDVLVQALLSTEQQPAMAILRGNGNGTFASPATLIAEMNNSTGEIALDDFTADGVLDYIRVETTRLTFYRGNVNGTFNPGVPLFVTSGGTNIVSCQADDLNADGIKDLTILSRSRVANADVTNYQVFLSRGDGTFESPLEYSGVPDQAQNGLSGYVRVLDSNRDGLPDYVSVNNWGQIALLESSSGGVPQILAGPANVTAPAGTPASLTVQAAGVGLTYQWFKNGTPILPTPRITGVTTPTLAFTALEPADASVYECRVSTLCSERRVHGFIAVAQPESVCPADFNGDQFVDFFDYLDFVAAFEEGC
jgi:hypothetical protein